ncbi:alpha/beta hydrolase [Halovenus sp. HT40]|uniref:alpha/beta hydrolase n=1 Tax=Halovenus sp. HT40 TaxID=3126691 RepID=UPI00300EBE22
MSGPHGDQPLITAGAPFEVAEAALILVHGRGARAQNFVQIADEFHQHGVAYLAPQAARDTWYPDAFTAPIESNEPERSSGLQAIDNAVREATDAGILSDRVMILGFSQGACLASEYVAHTPRRYGGLAVLSGGLMDESVDLADYDGDLERTPVFFGCSDDDPYIPERRVHKSSAIFEQLNGDVTKRLYEGLGHGINQDERESVSEMVANLLK